MKPAVVAAAVTVGLRAPASALAQDPTATTPAPAPAAAPAPVSATMKLGLSGTTAGGVLAGTRWAVVGTVKPYVGGQKVTVRLYRKGRKAAARAITIQPAADGAGTFTVGFTVKGSGRLTVRASHRASAGMATTVAKAVHVDVAARSAALGSRGLAVRILQTKLARLGYVTSPSGRFDDRTARAVLAFRKITGMTRTSTADPEVFRRLLKGQGTFKVKFPKHGRHVEGDLTHQVLALIDKGRAVRIYPMSSGKPSTPTILGNFRVYSKTPGTNAKGMIFSSYFIRGYAIHGYVDVPIYPASHGCLRVPPAEAVSIFSWIRFGTPVDTYYR